MISVAIFLSSIIIGLIGWWYYVFFRHRSYLIKYNGPSPIPIFGNAYKISSTKDIIPVFMEYLEKHGPVIKLWLGYSPKLVIADYKTAEKLMESTSILDKANDYKFFEPWLGTGLLTSTGNKWRGHRKLLTPTFHFQILENYISIFNKGSELLVEKLSTVVGKEQVDIYPFINLCSLDIVYESVMGVQINAQHQHNSTYIQNVEEISRIIFTRMVSPLKAFDWFYKLTADYKKEKHALSVLHAHTNFVIASREKELINCKANCNVGEDESGIKKRMAFLDLLLKSRESDAQLTTEDIREEVDTFMFEGHDTTSSGIAFTLYCLSLNLLVQNKVRREVQDSFQHLKGETPTSQVLKDMKYLEMVIKESMRLYPPVPIFARKLVEDTEFDGTILPKDICLTLFTYGLHRQKEVFEDPEKFDPERFQMENLLKRSPFSYLPFSAGVRNCIGQRFAMLAMKMVISKIVMNYEILPVEGFKPILTVDAILRSTNGVLVKLKKL